MCVLLRAFWHQKWSLTHSLTLIWSGALCQLNNIRLKSGLVSIISVFQDCGPAGDGAGLNTAPRCWWMTAINKLILNNDHAPCRPQHLTGQINCYFFSRVPSFSANYDADFFSFNFKFGFTVPFESRGNIHPTLSTLDEITGILLVVMNS